jgi:hypothetical protein
MEIWREVERRIYPRMSTKQSHVIAKARSKSVMSMHIIQVFKHFDVMPLLTETER